MDFAACCCSFLGRSFLLYVTDDQTGLWKVRMEKNLTVPPQTDMMIIGKLKRWCYEKAPQVAYQGTVIGTFETGGSCPAAEHWVREVACYKVLSTDKKQDLGEPGDNLQWIAGKLDASSR